MGNTFGRFFRVTTWGESHGKAIGAFIDGCPAGLELSESDIQTQLDRRRPGQSSLTSARQESDTVEILSGVYEGKTLGTPISLMIRNTDARPGDYASDVYRPSHADFTYHAKYGVPLPPGGGRASARETAARVAAAAIAQKLLKERMGIEIISYVSSVGGLHLPDTFLCPTHEAIETSPTRCPDTALAAQMAALIEDVKAKGDSVGGIITAHILGTPAGLGSPVFDRLEAELAKAMLSIPATKGFEIGSGFAGAQMLGSQHSDAFEMRGGKVRTLTNRSGGVQGGISNGEPIIFRVAFKPPATIALPQQTITHTGESITLESRGRHDPCVLPRAVPIVQAMAALVMIDAALMQNS